MRTLQERLAALQQSVASQSVNPPAAQIPLPAPGMGLEDLGFRRIDVGFGPVWHRELRYDLLTRHGRCRFSDILECNLLYLVKATGKGIVSAGDDPSLWCFFDTETTGLGTGAGTLPFLYGVAMVDADDLVVHQYFLAEYSEEGPLLQTLLAKHFAEGRTLVSFNGKSFDWPMIVSRLTMYRLSPPALQHVDLLHLSRRFWRQALERVTLAAVEEAVLGVTRHNDLPGREAPNRYFAFVDSQDAASLEPVFAHNAADVCSLLGLSALLADTMSGARTVTTANELLALARIYDDWHEFDLASRCYADAACHPDAAYRAHLLHSLFLKRQGLWEEAVAVWGRMAAEYPNTVPPLVELAKVAEHRERNFNEAREWARLALQRTVAQARVRSGQALDGADIRLLRHRIARIERRLQSQIGTP